MAAGILSPLSAELKKFVAKKQMGGYAKYQNTHVIRMGQTLWVKNIDSKNVVVELMDGTERRFDMFDFFSHAVTISDPPGRRLTHDPSK